MEGIPVFLAYAYTRAADEAETAELAALMSERCAAVGTSVELVDGRLLFDG